MQNTMMKWSSLAAIIVALLLSVSACGSRQAETPTVEPASATVAAEEPPAEAPSSPTDTPLPEPATATPITAATASPDAVANEAYPAPADSAAAATEEPSQAYPAPAATPAPDGYPAPQATVSKVFAEGPAFTIVTPVIEGSVVVSGSGPSSVPIRLVDVSESGVELATTVISDEGTFVFELAEPLPAGHTIGLMIGDTQRYAIQCR